MSGLAQVPSEFGRPPPAQVWAAVAKRVEEGIRRSLKRAAVLSKPTVVARREEAAMGSLMVRRYYLLLQ